MKKVFLISAVLSGLVLGACKVQVGDVKNGNSDKPADTTTTTTEPAK